MSIMSNAKRALAIAAAAATLLSMAACGSSNAASGKSDSSGAASSGKIEVVASINQWGSVAEDLDISGILQQPQERKPSVGRQPQSA